MLGRIVVATSQYIYIASIHILLRMEAEQKYNVADNLYVMYISRVGLLSLVFGICTFTVIYAHFQCIERRTFRLVARG